MLVTNHDSHTCWFIRHPAFTSLLATSRCPFMAAMCSGVLSRESRALTSAPASMSRSRHSQKFSSHATNSGVQCCSLKVLSDAPARISSSMVAEWFSSVAAISAVRPLLSRRSRSHLEEIIALTTEEWPLEAASINGVDTSKSH